MGHLTLVGVLTATLLLAFIALVPQPGAAISPTLITFKGTAWLRIGTAPLPIEPHIEISGAPPLVAYFVWGDGATSTTVWTSGTQATFDVTHTYTNPGNYSMLVNVTDNVGASWTSSYKVTALGAWSVVPGLTAYIEGYGKVSSLTRWNQPPSPDESDDIVVFLHNTGSAFLQSLKVEYYIDSDGWVARHSTTVQNVGIGQYAYAVAGGIAYSWSVSQGSHYVWARVTSPDYPGFNVTTPQMLVDWVDSGPRPSLIVTPFTPSVSASQGGYAKMSYLYTNNGGYTLDLYDTFTQSPQGNVFAMPADLGNPMGTLTIEGQTQHTVPGLATTLNLFQGMNRLILQPGESVIVNRTLQVTGATQTVLTDLFELKCLLETAGFDTWACGDTRDTGPIYTTARVTVNVEAGGAAIDMLAADDLGNGNVRFTGAVTSLGQNVVGIPVWFVWQNETAGPFKSAQTVVTVVGTVTATASGVGPGNYTGYMAALLPQGGGSTLKSNVISFIIIATTGGGGGGGNGTTTGQNVVTALLIQIGNSAGIPPIILGVAIGTCLLIAIVLALSVFEVDSRVTLTMILVGLVVNTLLFLWPSLVVLLIGTFIAILLAREFYSAGGGGEGE